MLFNTGMNVNTLKKVRLGSIDIGGANFSQYIEDMDVQKIHLLYKKYQSLPKQSQRKYKGPMNASIENILKEAYLSGTRVQTGVYNVRQNEEENVWDIGSRLKLFRHLESFRDLWKSCDVIFIEQQFVNLFSKAKKSSTASKNGESTANIDAIKIGEDTVSWMLINFPEKNVMFFGSQYKTQIMGAENGLTKYQRKAWSSKFARQIYTDRDDKGMKLFYETIDQTKFKRLDDVKIEKIMDSIKKECSEDDIIRMCYQHLKYKQKLDDISDACVQCQAFKVKFFVGDF